MFQHKSKSTKTVLGEASPHTMCRSQVTEPSTQTLGSPIITSMTPFSAPKTLRTTKFSTCSIHHHTAVECSSTFLFRHAQHIHWWVATYGPIRLYSSTTEEKRFYKKVLQSLKSRRTKLSSFQNASYVTLYIQTAARRVAMKLQWTFWENFYIHVDV